MALSAVALLGHACSRTLPSRWIEPTSRIEFALLQAGDFVSGSPATEAGHRPDEVLVPVRVSRAFYMATHEVSERQWALVMSPQTLPLDATADLPKVNIDWHEARQFVDRLSHGRPERFRLPTETEWEYACRGGTTTAYSTGPSLSTREANYNGVFPLPGQPAGENRARAMPVGSFPPNPWGLFDMHGNVWEWTNDGYDEEQKVIRGGSWRFDADSARCALRYRHRPQDRGDSVGVRVVRDLTREEAQRQ